MQKNGLHQARRALELAGILMQTLDDDSVFLRPVEEWLKFFLWRTTLGDIEVHMLRRRQPHQRAIRTFRRRPDGSVNVRGIVKAVLTYIGRK